LKYNSSGKQNVTRIQESYV